MRKVALVARIRTVKPDFFTSEDIVGLTPFARLLYIALWCEADREGRMSWRPGTFKLRYFPGDNLDIEALCKELTDRGLVILYGEGLAHIPTFLQHQHVNPREAVSSLPVPDACSRVTDAQVGRKEGKEGKGKEGDRRVDDAPVGLAPDTHRLEKNAEMRKTAGQVIEFLNAKAGRNFDLNGANADHVIARLKDGETVEDLRAVVAKKCRDWKGDVKMASYLRPETLFNRTKFASYKGELSAMS